MKVHDIMSFPPQTCPATIPLTGASRMMAELGCGTLVVLDEFGALAGIVTDRDLALAIGRFDVKAVTVGRVMTRIVRVCRQDDDVSVALATMERHKVRRLPVVDHDGTVMGVLSIDDVFRSKSPSGVVTADLLRAIRYICSAESARLREELAM